MQHGPKAVWSIPYISVAFKTEFYCICFFLTSRLHFWNSLAVWSVPYVSVALFPSFKQNIIAYHSFKVSDCIFENHQLWQSGFCRVYSNSYCSCSFEAEIIKIGKSSHKVYSNNIMKFHESTKISNACKKTSGNLLKAPRIYIYIYIYIYCDGKLTKIPKRDFIFAHVKTGQVGTWSLVE